MNCTHADLCDGCKQRPTVAESNDDRVESNEACDGRLPATFEEDDGDNSDDDGDDDDNDADADAADEDDDEASEVGSIVWAPFRY